MVSLSGDVAENGGLLGAGCGFTSLVSRFRKRLDRFISCDLKVDVVEALVALISIPRSMPFLIEVANFSTSKVRGLRSFFFFL